MFKTTVRAKSFFDDEVTTHTLYFNLSRRELFELASEYNGVNAFQDYVTAAQEDGDLFKIVEFTDNLLGKAYGERQGDRFVKSDLIRQNFIDGPVYEVLFDKIAADSQFAKELIEGIMPTKLLESLKDDPKYKEITDKI